MDKHGRKFAPYRSALAWYCWRALDEAEKKLNGSAPGILPESLLYLIFSLMIAGDKPARAGRMPALPFFTARRSRADFRA